jgi:serine/threonine-protein kinase
MIRPDGYVKVLDFGLAKLLPNDAAIPLADDSTLKQNETAKGLIMGTVNYMSPEQAKGERVDEGTDIFSLGVVMYEMIAGRTPFQGNSMSETFANLINTDPHPLARYSAYVPDELQRIVSKTLRKKRGERYQTIRELLTDLKELRKDLTVDERLDRSNLDDGTHPTELLRNTTGNGKTRAGETQQGLSERSDRKRRLVWASAALLLIASLGLGYYFYANRSSALNAKRSVAVLPFVNSSQDANSDYLSDGITESVINNLSQVSSLKVMSRNSAFRFKNDQTDIRGIAAKLGVTTLVTGDVRQVGDKFIINVRLIDASDESQVWGSQYVKSSADVLAAQSEIAQAVAQNLKVKLSSAEEQRLGKSYTQNAEAYQLYLRGRFHVFKLTPAEVNTGISYFQQAIDLDSNYALAYAGLSDAYRSLALGSEMSPAETMARSTAAARRAIEIDDTLSEGHSGLGMSMFWGQWNWSGAEVQYKRALELNPNSSLAHIFYAHMLSNTGRHAEALAEAAAARDLDPLFPFTGALEGQFLTQAGRTDEALDRLQKTTELDQNFWMPHLFASIAYIDKKDYIRAAAEAQKATLLGPSQTMSIAVESYALAASGKQPEARELLEKLQKLSAERPVPPYHLALVYKGLGEKDNALTWLERAIDQHDPKMAFLKVDTKWNDLRSEPRFVALMTRMNL